MECKFQLHGKIVDQNNNYQDLKPLNLDLAKVSYAPGL